MPRELAGEDCGYDPVSRLETLLTGEASAAADIINQTMPWQRDEILIELRAAIVNALRRIDSLEIELLELKIEREVIR